MRRKIHNVPRQVPIPGDPVVFYFSHIERNWETLAAVAWSGYLAHGRGALLFTQNSAGGKKWDCSYFPLFLMDGGPRTEKYRDMIRTYNPMTQIVALFLTARAHVAAFIGSLPEHLTPPNGVKRIGKAFDSGQRPC